MVALADRQRTVSDEELHAIAADVLGLPQTPAVHQHEAGYGFGV
jgi:hypothetical protein